MSQSHSRRSAATESVDPENPLTPSCVALIWLIEISLSSRPPYREYPAKTSVTSVEPLASMETVTL